MAASVLRSFSPPHLIYCRRVVVTLLSFLSHPRPEDPREDEREDEEAQALRRVHRVLQEGELRGLRALQERQVAPGE